MYAWVWNIAFMCWSPSVTDTAHLWKGSSSDIMVADTLAASLLLATATAAVLAREVPSLRRASGIGIVMIPEWHWDACSSSIAVAACQES